jgi:hypothetical protein
MSNVLITEYLMNDAPYLLVKAWTGLIFVLKPAAPSYDCKVHSEK